MSRNTVDSPTNRRGETTEEAFETAVCEAFAPAVRDAIYGNDPSTHDLRDRLERQLEGRGFTIVSDTESE